MRLAAALSGLNVLLCIDHHRTFTGTLGRDTVCPTGRWYAHLAREAAAAVRADLRGDDEEATA